MTFDNDATPMPKRAVAIIGGGPAGLVCARYLASNGFNPIIFEAASALGGQWNPSSPTSATWPGLRTNTSRVMTAFSELDHAPGVNVYPTQAEMLAYLHRYAELIDLDEGAVRLSSPVEALEPDPSGGWQVSFRVGARKATELYSRVVVATGYCSGRTQPAIEGLDTFAGDGGVTHSASYRGADPYRGRSVLVAGGSVSAFEIASDLAAAGVDVTVALRRQRYVLQKLLSGVPADHRVFTRFAARAAATLPPQVMADAMKRMVVTACGNPEQFGAPKPDDDIAVAGLTLSQSYLPLVAEGRIRPRPWIRTIEGRDVAFHDGSRAAFDGIILGTGFEPVLPFRSRALADALKPDGRGIDLFDHTFHPDLDGIAFAGLYPLVGPHLPVFEVQARWLTYVWALRCNTPSHDALEAGVRLARDRRDRQRVFPAHELATLFAQRAGIEPDPGTWPELERALWFGPLSPASFKLVGPDADPGARDRVIAAARAFGAIPDDELTPDEAGRLAGLGLGSPEGRV